ncbi:MAG: hypothetical protein AAF229_00955 [Pseudomonadota bacterium]
MHWFVDAHVHLHPAQLSPSSLVALADDAASNLTVSRPSLLWCLADMPGVDTLNAIREPSFVRSLSRLSVACQEDGSHGARLSADQWQLYIMNGSQIVSAEGLELLTIGGKIASSSSSSPAAELADLIDTTISAGFLPVVPWGAGKWLGRRGSVVSGLLKSRFRLGHLAIADSGVRPAGWRRPSQFLLAEEQGYVVLHGSDPLWVGSDQQRAGRFGFLLDGSWEDSPLDQLRTLLRRPASQRFFGRKISPWYFLKTQTMLRVQKK